MRGVMDYSRFDVPEGATTEGKEFTVEIYVGQTPNHGYDLWAEGLSWDEVESDCALLKKRGFRYRVRDERGVDYDL